MSPGATRRGPGRAAPLAGAARPSASLKDVRTGAGRAREAAGQGVLFVVLLLAIGYQDEEIQQLTDMGFFKAVLLLGRSIGFMGHYFDHKRLSQGPYRHPLDDILYDVPAEPESVDG